MVFVETNVVGAYIIELEPIEDERGYFTRTWCRSELESHGLNSDLEQINLGLSMKAGTLRGLHYQDKPHEEVKIVSCPQGAVFDVVADLRPDSASYLEWYGAELSMETRRMLYVPEGCAHGYITLQDNTVLVYSTSNPYAPDAANGMRWDDPALSIKWPCTPTVISKADQAWPLFQRGEASA